VPNFFGKNLGSQVLCKPHKSQGLKWKEGNNLLCTTFRAYCARTKEKGFPGRIRSKEDLEKPLLKEGKEE